jgi:hypothetical protein
MGKGGSMNFDTREGIMEWLLFACEDWQVETRTTKRGKVRLVAAAIPTKRFWDRFKHHKAEPLFRLAWQDLAATVFPLEKRKPTGEYVTVRGVKREIRRSQWELSLYVNRHNRPALEAAGIIQPETPEETPETWEEQAAPVEVAEDCPF